MNERRTRDVEIGAVLWFLGVVILSTLCVGSVLLFNTVTQRRTPAPTLAFAPEAVTIATLTPTTEVIVVVAPTLTLAPTVVTPTMVIQAAGGSSCKYGPPFINPVATPVPDGGHSEYQDYLCVNGYWYIGTQDWLDSEGDWGTDGTAENGYIMFNADGSIADRKFTNLSGTVIPGPKK